MEHFVYVTTNVKTGKFYIGKHSTKNIDDGYQGSGIWVLRAKKKKSPLFTRVIKKFNSEKDAYSSEYEIIVAAKELWPNLCMNIADGGVGFSCSYPSNRTGENAPMYGKKHSEKTKAHLAEVMSYRRGESHHMYGKKHSEKSKIKMSETHRSIGHLRGKKVKSLTTGKIYASLADAARDVAGSVKARSNIRDCINGKAAMSYGHKWKFIEE